MSTSYYFVITLVFLFNACQPPVKDEQSYYHWLDDKENGLVRSKTANGLVITAKYLPADYLVYKELKGKNYGAKERDSLLAIYSKSRTFLLTIAPQEIEGSPSEDIMYKDVRNIEEYKQRADLLNFKMDEFILLHTDKKEYRPVLSMLENTYSVGNSRNLYLVFTDEEDWQKLGQGQQLDLVFNDELFSTGINHFVFDNKKIAAVPRINFWKLKQ
jgi:hypothetical protein